MDLKVNVTRKCNTIHHVYQNTLPRPIQILHLSLPSGPNPKPHLNTSLAIFLAVAGGTCGLSVRYSSYGPTAAVVIVVDPPLPPVTNPLMVEPNEGDDVVGSPRAADADVLLEAEADDGGHST